MHRDLHFSPISLNFSNDVNDFLVGRKKKKKKFYLRNNRTAPSPEGDGPVISTADLESPVPSSRSYHNTPRKQWSPMKSQSAARVDRLEEDYNSEEGDWKLFIIIDGLIL